MKKFAIIFCTLIVALLVFGYVQIDRAKTQLFLSLQKNEIKFKDVDIQLVPSPTLVIKHPQYNYNDRSIFFDESVFNISIFSLLSGKPIIQNILFSNGMSQSLRLSNVTVKLSQLNLALDEISDLLEKLNNPFVFDRTLKKLNFYIEVNFVKSQYYQFDFSGQIGIHKNIHLSNLSLDLLSSEELYSKNKKVSFKINQGMLTRKDERTYQLISENIQINHGDIDDVNTEIYLPLKAGENNYLSIKGKDSYIKIDWKKDRYLDGVFNISVVSSMDTEKWFKLIDVPEFLSGYSEFKAEINIKNGKLEESNYWLSVKNGAIQGLNMLSIMSQYVPINYDEDELSKKSIDSHFSHLYLTGFTNDSSLLLTDINIEMQDLIGEGQGIVDFLTSECDIELQLGLNKNKYSEYSSLRLPVHFWGKCDNPQYKIIMNKTLLKQLKPLLLEKLRH